MSAASITRRSLVQAGAAAFGTMVAPIAASAAPVPPFDPDAPVFDLIRRHGEARAGAAHDDLLALFASTVAVFGRGEG